MSQQWPKKSTRQILADAQAMWFVIDATEYSNGLDYISFTKQIDGKELTVWYDSQTRQFGGSYGDYLFDNTTTDNKQQRLQELLTLFYTTEDETIPRISES